MEDWERDPIVGTSEGDTVTATTGDQGDEQSSSGNWQNDPVVSQPTGTTRPRAYSRQELKQLNETPVYESQRVEAPEISAYEPQVVTPSGEPLAPETTRAAVEHFLFSPEVAQNLRSTIQETVYGLPHMALDFAKGAYNVAKFKTGTPQQQAQVVADLVGQGVPMGEATAKGIQSPVGSKEWFSSMVMLAQLGLPGLEAFREWIRPEGPRVPPVQRPEPAAPPAAIPGLPASAARLGLPEPIPGLEVPAPVRVEGPAPLPPRLSLEPPARIAGPAPAPPDIREMADWAQGRIAEGQKLGEQERLIREAGLPVPKDLADAIARNNEELRRGPPPGEERRFVMEAPTEPQPERRFVAEVQPPLERVAPGERPVPIEQPLGGEQRAEQPGYAQVQAQRAALREQARPPGAEPPAGGGYNVVGAPERAPPGGQLPPKWEAAKLGPDEFRQAHGRLSQVFGEPPGGDWRRSAFDAVQEAVDADQPINARLMDEVVKNPPSDYVRRGDLYEPQDWTRSRQEAAPLAEKARRKIAENQKRNRGGFLMNEDIWPDLVDLGRRVLRRGMDFARWGREMLGHLGNVIRPHLRDIWRQVTRRDILPHAREEMRVAGGAGPRRGVRHPVDAAWGWAGKFLTKEQKATVRDSFIREVTGIFDQLKPEMTIKDAIKGRFLKGWYEKFGNWMTDLFGDDKPRFARLFGAFGANTPPLENTVRALEVWTNWIERGRPRDFSSIDRILEDTIISEEGRKAGYTADMMMAWRNNVRAVLSAEDPGVVRLSGPKVDPYAEAFLGNLQRTVLDRHMGIPFAMQRGFTGRRLEAEVAKGSGIFGRRVRTQPGGRVTQIQGFPGMAFEASIREAAQRLSRRTGERWAPGNVQEAVWGHVQPMKLLAQEMGVPVDKLLSGELPYDRVRLAELQQAILPERILQDETVQSAVERYKTSRAAEEEAGRARGEGGGPAVQPARSLSERARRLRKDTRAAGYTTLFDFQRALDIGRDIYRRGMRYAGWAGRMISTLGERIRGHLPVLWRNVEAGNRNYVFYSPNVSDIDLPFATAHAEMRGASQVQARAVGRAVDDALGHQATYQDAIGDWRDGAENSVFSGLRGVRDFDELRYNAAMKGLELKQKSVLAFQRDRAGTHSLYRFIVPTENLNRVRSVMDANDVQFRTLLPQEGKTPIVVFDQDPAASGISGRLIKIADTLSPHEPIQIDQIRGKGEFVGEAPTREEAAANYRQIAADYQSRFPDRRRYGPGRPGLRDYGRPEPAAAAPVKRERLVFKEAAPVAPPVQEPLGVTGVSRRAREAAKEVDVTTAAVDSPEEHIKHGRQRQAQGIDPEKTVAQARAQGAFDRGAIDDAVTRDADLTLAAREARRKARANPTDPGLQNAAADAEAAQQRWEDYAIQPIRGQFADTGRSLQTAIDLETGEYVDYLKAFRRANKGQQPPPAVQAALRKASAVASSVRDSDARYFKNWESELQKEVKPRKTFRNFDELKGSLDKLKDELLKDCKL